MTTHPTTFFSSHDRTLDTEDEIVLTSVGVDIGSATSHLVFSKIVMQRRDEIYVVAKREVLFASDILLTPYADGTAIDADALGAFVDEQYRRAGIGPADIDTGALILTGLAVRRSNARAIGELFADHAGKFVAVSAGDSLEAALVAYGSGAVALSERDGLCVMNVDVGGGTSKIAVCEDGEITDRTVIDVGARIICFDADGRVSVMEEAGRYFAAEAGVTLAVGERPAEGAVQRIVARMAERLMQAMGAVPMDEATKGLLRMPPLAASARPDALTFSGGVSEYVYGREAAAFGDLGPPLAAEIGSRARTWGPRIDQPVEGIRATVVGASQYTTQVSGSTIFVAPDETLPLRNVPAISPALGLDADELDSEAIAAAIRSALSRFELDDGKHAVAMYFRWGGSATYGRLDAFCRGVIRGFEPVLGGGHPLVLVTMSDIGGLVGLHCYEECELANPVVSIDGIAVRDFDFIDIGALLDSSGVVPVVIKSLVFPPTAALGSDVSR